MIRSMFMKTNQIIIVIVISLFIISCDTQKRSKKDQKIQNNEISSISILEILKPIINKNTSLKASTWYPNNNGVKNLYKGTLEGSITVVAPKDYKLIDSTNLRLFAKDFRDEWKLDLNSEELMLFINGIDCTYFTEDPCRKEGIGIYSNQFKIDKRKTNSNYYEKFLKGKLHKFSYVIKSLERKYQGRRASGQGDIEIFLDSIKNELRIYGKWTSEVTFHSHEIDEIRIPIYDNKNVVNLFKN